MGSHHFMLLGFLVGCELDDRFLTETPTDPVFAMAVQVLLHGAQEKEDVLILAASIVAAVLSGRHADNMWLCRCISACCAGWLCPDDGPGKVVAIVTCMPP